LKNIIDLLTARVNSSSSFRVYGDSLASPVVDQIEIGLSKQIEFLLDISIENLDNNPIKQHLIDQHTL